MAHINNIISSIKLPNGTTYEIHDAQAIHNIEDLGLSAALIFKGTKSADAEILAITNANVGEVWLATSSNTEYVCVAEIAGTANAAAWEKLGNVHDAASSTHTHGVTVAGTNAASTVTGTVTVPTVSKTQKYMTASAAAPESTGSGLHRGKWGHSQYRPHCAWPARENCWRRCGCGRCGSGGG